MTNDISETAKAVVRRNTIEVQGGGNWELFDELFADDFHDYTPQPGGKPDKPGVLELYRRLREAFPDFTPEIHWQKADGDVVMTYKTYHGSPPIATAGPTEERIELRHGYGFQRFCNHGNAPGMTPSHFRCWHLADNHEILHAAQFLRRGIVCLRLTTSQP